MKHGGKKAFHSQDNSCGYWDSIPVQLNTDQFNQMGAGVEWTQPNEDLTGFLSLPERIEWAWQEKYSERWPNWSPPAVFKTLNVAGEDHQIILQSRFVSHMDVREDVQVLLLN